MDESITVYPEPSLARTSARNDSRLTAAPLNGSRVDNNERKEGVDENFGQHLVNKRLQRQHQAGHEGKTTEMD